MCQVNLSDIKPEELDDYLEDKQNPSATEPVDKTQQDIQRINTQIVYNDDDQEVETPGNSDEEIKEELESEEDDFSTEELQEQQQEQAREEVLEDDTQEDYPEFASSFQAVRWAEQNNEAIKIYYKTKSGASLQRDFEPHGIYVSEESNALVVGYDRTVNDIRSFIIKNIKDYQFLGEKFNNKFNFVPN